LNKKKLFTSEKVSGSLLTAEKRGKGSLLAAEQKGKKSKINK
jgi:hypothetical protein